jgi:glycosyltransferase involved in cell wall biosynthesis
VIAEKFSNYSKPKVLAFSKNINKYNQSDIELIKVNELKNEDIIKLNPDLIITDRDNKLGLKELEGNNLNLRRKWVTLPKKSNIGLHESAILNNLIRYTDLISIFTSAYNIKEKILKTYESLIKQSYSNWEWVIVDDSTDNGVTYKVLKRISDNDSRVKVYSFNEKSGGCIGEAKYRAAMLCNGEYLVELDHDDYLIEDCLELLVKGYQENPDCGFVYSDAAEVDQYGNSNTYPEGFAYGYSHHYESIYKGKAYYPSVAPALNPKSIRHIVSVPNHVRSWRASVYHQLRGHNRRMRIADDYELMVRTFLVTRWLHVPKMLYLQNFDGGNSQDAGGNRADIQIRVKEIVGFYSNQISKRFKELGGHDFCHGIPLNEIYNTVHDPNTPSFHKILQL